MEKKYILNKSTERPNWWVLTDTSNLVVIRFEEHKFNETQEVSVLDESKLLQEPDCASKLAGIMQEIGEYMFTHHYSVALPVPVYELREDEENDRLLLIRHKYPRFTVEIQDECEVKELADALKKANEFLIKRTR